MKLLSLAIVWSLLELEGSALKCYSTEGSIEEASYAGTNPVPQNCVDATLCCRWTTIVLKEQYVEKGCCKVGDCDRANERYKESHTSGQCEECSSEFCNKASKVRLVEEWSFFSFIVIGIAL